KIGAGKYASVYELEGEGKVIKFFRIPEGSKEALADIMRDVKNGSKLLDENNIPLAAIDLKRSAFEGELPFVIQEQVRAEDLAEGFSFNLTEDMQKAIVKLYAKFGKAGLIWEDGRLANMFFKREG